jgi:hypothetical protein
MLIKMLVCRRQKLKVMMKNEKTSLSAMMHVQKQMEKILV